MSKRMGIDYGLERTGLAVTDPGGSLVFPLMTLNFREFKNRHEFFDALSDIIRNEKIEELVWGLPLGLDGSENLMCAQIRNAARRLARRAPLPVHFMPEALSSFEAEDDLKKIGLKGDKLKKALDQRAACRILESWLNLRQRGTGHEESL